MVFMVGVNRLVSRVSNSAADTLRAIPSSIPQTPIMPHSSDKNLCNPILSAIIVPNQFPAHESPICQLMPRSRHRPILSILASCIAAGIHMSPGSFASPAPINVSFPNQTVLSTDQPFGSSIVVADLDGDGWPDVVAASLQDNEISWYRNQHDGSFSSALPITAAAYGPSSIVAADIDADGRIDIVSASELDNKIAWYRNVGGSPAAQFGNPSSNQRIISTSAQFAFSVTVADVNSDGLWDVVSASLLDSKIAYYLNLGGGNFGWKAASPGANQHVISTEGGAPTCVAAGDLNGDGIFDLAVTSVNDDTLAWFEGGYTESGEPTFTRHIVSNQQDGAYNVAISDLNKDRHADLICAAPHSMKVTYFKNTQQAAGSAEPLFAPEQIVSSEMIGVSSVLGADINRDGNPDIVCTLLSDNRILWFPSNGVDETGDITFGNALLVSGETQGPIAVAVADFDGDGVMDVTSSSQDDSKVAVFLNAGEFNGDVTIAPTLTAPESGTVTTTPVTISYTLPEDALPGSVTINFVSGAMTRELIVGGVGETAGAHTFSFDPAHPADCPALAGGAASIKDGTYTVTVSYQDSVGNPAAASQPANGVVIDAEAPYLPGASTKVLAAKGGVVPGAGTSGSGVPADARLRLLGVPSINEAGHLAITATYTSGTNLRRAIIGPDAAGKSAVLVGADDPAPNASGVSQPQWAFVNFADVLLNDTDAIAFVGSIRGVGATAASVNARNNIGIWTNAGDGRLRMVAREYDPAPGTTVRFASFTSVALSSTFVREGETVERANVAFVAKLQGTGVASANDEGLWTTEILSTGESTTRLLLRKGLSVSLRAGVAKRIRGIVALPPTAGADGQGRGCVPSGVTARLEFTDLTQAIVQVGADGVVHHIAVSYDDLADTGARMLRFGVPTQNTFGDTMISALLNSRTNNSALVLTPAGGEPVVAARSGDDADGITGGVFSGFKIGVVNAEQSYAFLGATIGRGVSAGNDEGVWFFGQSTLNAGTGAPVLIAREGAQPPGTPAGARWDAFRSIALPDGATGPVFLADLQIPAVGHPNPARVTASNSTGLWAVDSNGALRLIVRQGDIFPGTSLSIRAISILGNVLGSPGQTRSFNSHAELIYRATLSDGSEAIAKARVP